jgi:multidrug efflux pump subunit AcrB
VTERRDLFAVLTRYRIFVIMLGVGLLFGGVISLTRLGSGIYPEVDFPRIAVVARSSDLTPALMQAAVVRPLEESLVSVPGARRIRTRIIRGAAEIALQFEDGSDMQTALQLAGTAVANAREELPEGTEVETQRITPADFPILSFDIVGGDATSRREAAEFVVRPAFSMALGVGRVEVVGGDPREVEIIVDPARLAATGLSPNQLTSLIENGIVRTVAGRFDRDRQAIAATVTSGGAEPAELARLPIAPGGNGALHLGDVATVVTGAPDRALLVHDKDGEAVQVAVARTPKASAPEVVRQIEAIAKTLTLPPGLRLVQVYNQGELIRDSILGIRDAIGIGILLTIGVLIFFLRDARAGILAALSVPTALIATFLAIDLSGETLNLMSLGGMAIAIGLVIDDAIVVVEAIALRLESGDAPHDAVTHALHEITGPVVGTTITTVVVLAPLAFLSGLVGRFFSALAITLGSAVLFSLVFAIVILPIPAARFMRARKTAPGSKPAARGMNAYVRALTATLGHPWIAAVVVTVAVALAAIFAMRIPSGFLPEMDEGAFVIDYFMPAGTSLEATDAVALRIEKVLAGVPGVVRWTRRTGAELGPITATETNSGDIAVALAPRKSRPDAEEMIDDVRERLEAAVPEARIEFVQILEDVLNDLSGAPRPIEVRTSGEDPAILRTIGQDISRRLEGTPSLVDFYDGIEAEVPIREYRVNPEIAVHAGLAPADVAANLAIALHGTVVGAVPRFDRLVPVRARFPDEIRFDPARLDAAPIAVSGAELPLGSFATGVMTKGASLLRRENLQPTINATADVEGSDLGGLTREVRHRLEGLNVPAGYNVTVGGLAESQAKAFRQLGTVALIGVVIVFAVLVAQFRSARAALLVLLTIPPAVAGGLTALAVTRTNLDVSSLMGLVLLVGLVVKNGILLIGAALTRMEEGIAVPEALLAAAERRFRPIIMTTACTIFGLIPLAFGLGPGSELQRPLAVVVIGGLVVSTAATLLALPALAELVLRGETSRRTA